MGGGRNFLLLLAILSLPLTPKSECNAAEKPLQKVRAGYVSPSTDNVLLPIAQKRGFLRHHGIEVEIIALRGGVQMAQALLSDSLQFAQMAGSVVVRSVLAGGDLVMAGLGASDENIAKKPDFLRRAVRATLRGIDFLRDAKNKKEVAGIMVAWFKIRIEQAEEAYGQMVEAYPPNGVVADEVIEKDLEIARQTGAIKNRVALSRVVDFQFVKEARNELSGKKP